MIKAVIFGCFGVLVEDGWRKLREDTLSKNPEKLAKAYEIDDLVNAGKITYPEFIDGVAKLVGLTAQGVVDKFSQIVRNDLNLYVQK